MRKADHIVLLNPALENNSGGHSSNLGDQVIGDSIIKVLSGMFPGKEIIQYSSHSFLDRKARESIAASYLTFVGGTNLLYSDMITYRQLALRKGKLLWLFPGIRHLVLVGAGWGPDYENKLGWKTTFLYNNILHKGLLHSVRDGFTAHKLAAETSRKTINTACTTMWQLDGFSTNLETSSDSCLFTLTDYRKDSDSDNRFIEILLQHFPNLWFFPQGRGDLEYIKSLSTYLQNPGRINLLPHDLRAFREFTRTVSFIYIGTRLHGGIECMNAGKKALILAVDNRAREMGKDFFLPVVPRNEIGLIRKWITGEKLFPNNVSLPQDNIIQWKNQFK